jgi:hypothetical protein
MHLLSTKKVFLAFLLSNKDSYFIGLAPNVGYWQNRNKLEEEELREFYLQQLAICLLFITKAARNCNAGLRHKSVKVE